MKKKRGPGRPKEANTMANDGGKTSIGVGRDTLDKLQEKAGDIPLSRFLKRFAESDIELKDDKDIIKEVNTLAALIIDLPFIAFHMNDFPEKTKATAEKLDYFEAIVWQTIREAFMKARQVELPEVPASNAMEVL